MNQRDALINYLRAKVDAGDWHGVSDAANDLRVLEVSEVTARLRDSKPHVHAFQPFVPGDTVCTCGMILRRERRPSIADEDHR